MHIANWAYPGRLGPTLAPLASPAGADGRRLMVCLAERQSTRVHECLHQQHLLVLPMAHRFLLYSPSSVSVFPSPPAVRKEATAQRWGEG